MTEKAAKKAEQYRNEYKKANYARLSLLCSKERAEEIKAAAKAHECSISEYLSAAVDRFEIKCI